MQFKENTSVYTADGQQVGVIDRVVLDPQTNEVSHVVVRQGWLFTEDKVVPTALIDVATEEEVRLRADVDNLDELPLFEVTHYIPYDDTAYANETATTAAYPALGYARPLYGYPPLGGVWGGYYSGYYAYPTTPYAVETERNIPEGSIALKQGASVFASNGESVGQVARVFVDEETQQVTHLLISEGWLFKEKRIVPADWIKSVIEDEVQLAVNTGVLNQLPEYRG